MDSLRVAVGTYDGLMCGLRMRQDRKTDDTKDSQTSWSLTPHFGCEAHEGSTKQLASSSTSPFVASAGSDDRIRVYDAEKRVEYGALFEHTGTVTCLEFYKGSHLLSGSEDGNICVWKTAGWVCLSTLKGHSNAVWDLSIHPSGKAAISVGKDQTLRLWNLVKGVLAGTTKLLKEADLVSWTPSGEYYAIVSDALKASFVPHQLLTVFNADGSVRTSIASKSSIWSFVFLSDHHVALGCEDGEVHIWELTTRQQVLCLRGHKSRIRGLSAVSLNTEGNAVNHGPTPAAHVIIVSGSSDGMVCVWKVQQAELTRVGQSPVAKEADDEDEAKNEAAGTVQDTLEHEIDDEHVRQVPLARKKLPYRITSMCAICKMDAGPTEVASADVKPKKTKKKKNKTQALQDGSSGVSGSPVAERSKGGRKKEKQKGKAKQAVQKQAGQTEQKQAGQAGQVLQKRKRKEEKRSGRKQAKSASPSPSGHKMPKVKVTIKTKKRRTGAT